jgi:hypothetical protein
LYCADAFAAILIIAIASRNARVSSFVASFVLSSPAENLLQLASLSQPFLEEVRRLFSTCDGCSQHATAEMCGVGL